VQGLAGVSSQRGGWPMDLPPPAPEGWSRGETPGCTTHGWIVEKRPAEWGRLIAGPSPARRKRCVVSTVRPRERAIPPTGNPRTHNSPRERQGSPQASQNAGLTPGQLERRLAPQKSESPKATVPGAFGVRLKQATGTPRQRF